MGEGGEEMMGKGDEGESNGMGGKVGEKEGVLRPDVWYTPFFPTVVMMITRQSQTASRERSKPRALPYSGRISSVP